MLKIRDVPVADRCFEPLTFRFGIAKIGRALASRPGANNENVMTRPAIPAPPYTGSCLCGRVRYSIAARPLALNACHCDDCKKLSGASHIVMLVAPRDAFTHASGAVERYRKRGDSGREIDLARCAQCGVRLWHEPLTAPNLTYVAVGTLDDPSWAVPASHIWIERAAPGTQFEEDAVVLSGAAADRQALLEAFRKLYPD